MIAQFPCFYPDELVYSLLARYYSNSGYMAYTFAAQDLFQSKTVRPDIEFINLYTDDAYTQITRDMPMGQVILHHTMFPYYGRFINTDRRNKAFQALTQMQGNYNNLLAIPKNINGEFRYLRYCPECADTDREQYGETYWHRIHQMRGVDICPIHKNKLLSSSVIISGKASPSLLAAESVVPKNSISAISESEIEYRFAEYTMNVFKTDIDFKSNTLVGDFLHSKMYGTKYLSVRGEQRNITLFHTDFTEYYKDLPNNRFTELWKIQKVLTNDRFNMVEICMMAMFLNVAIDDFVRLELPEKSQEQLFDEAVHRLHEQGLKYSEIAKRLNASINTIKPIGEGRYGTYHKSYKKPLKSGAKPRDWSGFDKYNLPLVKRAVKELEGNGITRPKKITIFAIEKMLGLNSKQINNMPICKKEILKHYISQQEYWAKEVAWAANKVIRDGHVLNWKRIRNLTNMRKRDLEACLTYVEKFADDELCQKIKML